jgi:hypothetical protein
MPFQSKAQQRWMFANHPDMAKEWAEKTDFSKLPDKKMETRHRHRCKQYGTRCPETSDCACDYCQSARTKKAGEEPDFMRAYLRFKSL